MRPPSTQYIFVVDTDTYAGNFERELTAYVTGVLGECEVGSEYAEMFRATHPDRVEWFENIMSQIPDNHGCRRPASIYPTPGWFNDGMGDHYPDEMWGSQEVKDRYREKAENHKHLKNTDPGRFPAHLSVAMFLEERPSPEIVGFMIQRARQYNEEAAAGKLGTFTKAFKVTGFRLLQEVTTTDTLRTWEPDVQNV